MTAINSRAVAMMRWYSAGLIKKTKDELRKIDRKTRKTMKMHKALHPQADVDTLYIPRNNGGREIISVDDCVGMETENLNKYVENSNERLLKAEGKGILGNGKTKKEILKRRNEVWR